MTNLNNEKRKGLTVVGDCPQGKGYVTSVNSEKCQRCAREAFLEGEVMERNPLPQDTREYFDLKLDENKLRRKKARVLTKSLKIG